MSPPASELLDRLARVYAQAVVDALLAADGACQDTVVTGAGTGASPEISGEIAEYAANAFAATGSGGTGAGTGPSPEISGEIAEYVANQLPAIVTDDAGTSTGVPQAYRGGTPDESCHLDPL